MLSLPVLIKNPPRGNDKLGPVLTESRPSGPSCPKECPFRKSGQCYSIKGEQYHPGPIKGWVQRDDARKKNWKGWRENRKRHWTREAMHHRPVRFLVHGDLFTKNKLDRKFLADVLSTARTIPGFKGWAYTHGWLRIPQRTVHHLKRAGITLWASVHSREQAQEARALGFPIAMVSTDKAKGYQGPKSFLPESSPTGQRALVCPHQTGKSRSCLDCGFCWNGKAKTDLVLLAH